MSSPNTDPVQAMLAQTALIRTLFDASSRYYGVPTETIQIGSKTVGYLSRRFLPDPSQFQALEQYSVVEGDRLDNLAARFLGDPSLFWRMADANNAVRPEELVATPGATILITMPQGVTGARL